MKTTELLTVEEVADRLKCHPQTVRRWIWSGKLGHVKVGGLVRVPEEEVGRLLEEGMRSRVGMAAGGSGVEALRAAMRTSRESVAPEDIEELNRKIAEGDQAAEWNATVE